MFNLRSRLSNVLSDVRRPWRSRARLKQQAGLLVPGWWLPVTDDLWRRRGTPVPAQLWSTKVAGQRARRCSAGSRPRRLKQRARHALTSLVRPRAVRIGSRGRQDGYRLMLSANAGAIVFLDPDGGRVARIEVSGLSSRDVEYRECLRRHGLAPDFEVNGDGRVLVEEYVEGRLLRDLPAQLAVPAVRDLFRSHSSLVRAEEGRSSEQLVGRVLEATDRAQLPPSLRDRLAAPVVRIGAATWPAVPCDADAGPHNVVVRRRTNTPMPIDLANLSVLPFFYGPLSYVSDLFRLPGTETGRRSPLQDVYFSGGFDAEMSALFRAAGESYDASPAGREGLLAFTLVTKAYLFLTNSSGFDPHRFERVATSLWTKSGLDHAEAASDSPSGR